MTMHLEGPWLSTTGRRKAKHKWASAEQKRQHEQLQAEWQSLKERTMSTKSSTFRPLTRAVPKLGPPPGRETPHIPSRDSGIGVAAKKDVPVYTGDKMLGVTIMHKSCLQPVFSEQAAVEAAHMRR